MKRTSNIRKKAKRQIPPSPITVQFRDALKSFSAMPAADRVDLLIQVGALREDERLSATRKIEAANAAS
jgi:hypothetical protein